MLFICIPSILVALMSIWVFVSLLVNKKYGKLYIVGAPAQGEILICSLWVIYSIIVLFLSKKHPRNIIYGYIHFLFCGIAYLTAHNPLMSILDRYRKDDNYNVNGIDNDAFYIAVGLIGYYPIEEM